MEVYSREDGGALNSHGQPKPQLHSVKSRSSILQLQLNMLAEIPREHAAL